MTNRNSLRIGRAAIGAAVLAIGVAGAPGFESVAAAGGGHGYRSHGGHGSYHSRGGFHGSIGGSVGFGSCGTFGRIGVSYGSRGCGSFGIGYRYSSPGYVCFPRTYTSYRYGWSGYRPSVYPGYFRGDGWCDDGPVTYFTIGAAAPGYGRVGIDTAVTVGHAAEPPPERVVVVSARPAHDPAWDALGAGNDSEAMARFASAAAANPDDALSRLGYAVSSASLRNDDRAVWALRRALATDADVLSEWPSGCGLDALRQRLESRYKALGYRYVHTPDRDALLMLAALRYVGDDADGARAAMTDAYPGGRDYYDDAARNLSDAIDALAAAQHPVAEADQPEPSKAGETTGGRGKPSPSAGAQTGDEKGAPDAVAASGPVTSAE